MVKVGFDNESNGMVCTICQNVVYFQTEETWKMFSNLIKIEQKIKAADKEFNQFHAVSIPPTTENQFF